MPKNKRSELVGRLVAILGESDLPLDGQIQALAEARTRIQRSVSRPGPEKSFKPLTRPSGNVMGKQKRVAKEE